ncbi:hypothetical protein GVN21_17285 [Caulobacter sp. SLTY]|uniref:hypothetical protein n=1 Tax=Caulobacter sp. SLTY TaxID=2683262 RepID=UPI001412612F|nr:hypothetical protein [Caulobacter sp. SLTY]NBB17121.1 hypothetical protein [Caulobacter sp. SLTY]
MGALLGLLVFVMVSLAPMIAATFVAVRLGRRGLWLALPWAGLIALGLLLSVGIYALAEAGRVTTSDPNAFPAAYSALAGAMLISGYLCTLVYLIALAIAGPGRSRTAAADVF